MQQEISQCITQSKGIFLWIFVQVLICDPELGDNTNVIYFFFFTNVYFFAVGLDHWIGANWNEKMGSEWA